MNKHKKIMSKKAEEVNKVELDDLDLRIIEELRANCKQSWRNLARKMHVSPVTIMNRVHALERNGVIRGYGVRLNYKKLGFEVASFVGISVPGTHFEKLSNDLTANPDISGLYAVGGDYDLIAFFRARNMDDLARIVQSIYRREDVRSHSFVAMPLKEDYEKTANPPGAEKQQNNFKAGLGNKY
jgi:DNA-binding Lrp family transcriptional regulator